MGKFRTSAQEAQYVTNHCSKCVHYGKPSKGQDCPVMLIHWLYMDRRKSNIELATILDSLIPMGTVGSNNHKTNRRCKMFHKKPAIKEYDVSVSQFEMKQ